jgi:hypothetical protein
MLSAGVLHGQVAKRWPLEWLPLVVSAMLAIFLMDCARAKLIDLNLAALGGQTTAVLGEADGVQVACSDVLDTKSCESAYQQAGRPPAIVWFGNSQNFAINRYQRGDELATVSVHRWLKHRGAWLVAYSEPNVNLYENALLFEALVHRYHTRLVILPVFMDKLREQGIRESLASFIDDPATGRQIRNSPAWNDLAPFLVKKADDDHAERSLQQYVESRLNGVLDEWLPLWHDRSNLRGNLGFIIHNLHHKLLGIHSYTKRPVDRQVYAEKLEVLEKILTSARNQNIPMLLYIPPYRHDISGPYDDAQYAQFKRDVASLAARYQTSFADLDDIVAGPLWATTVDPVLGFEEPDFMHFTAEGHRRLAKAIESRLLDLGF